MCPATQGVTVAVKKATAKKSAAKKATAKKSTTKKAVVKKAVVKKAAVKKAAVKKVVVKKAAVKKTTVKKTVTRKSAARKSAPENIVIPEAPITPPRNSRVEVASTPSPAPVAMPAPVAKATPVKKKGASGRVIFAVALGIILLGIIVWAKSHNPDSSATATPSPTPTASATQSPSPTPSPSDTEAVLTAHEAPQGVVAHYTTTGATIFWKAPTATDGLTSYNVEISVSNSPWKLISTVPATQISLDITKESSVGWTSFKVASVYSDSENVPAKAFGLPGTFS